MILTAKNILPEIVEALTEINLRNHSFFQAERRLAEKMKPGRLVPFNHSHANGRAASTAVIERIRR